MHVYMHIVSLCTASSSSFFLAILFWSVQPVSWSSGFSGSYLDHEREREDSKNSSNGAKAKVGRKRAFTLRPEHDQQEGL